MIEAGEGGLLPLSHVDNVVCGAAERIVMDGHWWRTAFQQKFEDSNAAARWIRHFTPSDLRRFYIRIVACGFPHGTRKYSCLSTWSAQTAKPDEAKQAAEKDKTSEGKGGASKANEGRRGEQDQSASPTSNTTDSTAPAADTAGGAFT